MPCKCRAKGCQNNADCGEEYCEWHLIELDENNMPPDEEHDD